MRLVSEWLLWPLAALLGLVIATPAYSQEVVPPFGFYWGEGQKKIEKVVGRDGAQIVEKSNVRGRDAWTIEGLIQPALQRTIVYFGTDKDLVEVELQYQHSDWDLVAYEQFLDSARQRLEARYGTATVLAKDKKAGRRYHADDCRIRVEEAVREHPALFLIRPNATTTSTDRLAFITGQAERRSRRIEPQIAQISRI